MRNILVDRRLFWPGFAVSLGGGISASLLFSSGTSPSMGYYGLALSLMLVGPLLVVFSTYPSHRIRRPFDALGSNSEWPPETTWPQTQFVTANLWVLVAGFALLVAGAVTFFLWPLNLVPPGPYTYTGPTLLVLWAWVQLASVALASDSHKETRNT